MSDTPLTLTMDQAVAQITEGRMQARDKAEEPAAPAEPEQTQEIEAEGADPEPALEPEEPAPVTGDQGEAVEPEETPVIDAPSSWPTDRLDEWNDLSDSAREVILARESEIQTAISEKGREAAEARRKADEAKTRAETELQSRIEKLDGLIPRLEANAKSKWEKTDWVKLAQELDAEDYNKLRAEHEADQQAYKDALEEANRAHAEQGQTFREEQYRRLLDKNPAYRGENGAKVLSEDAAMVQAYAAKLDGVTPEQLSGITADIFITLLHAAKYEQAQAKTKPSKPKKQSAQKTAPTSGRKPAPTRQQSRQESLKTIDTVRTAGGGLNAQLDAAVAGIVSERRKN